MSLFKKSVNPRKCADCGKEMKRGIIFDWIQRLPWCADCFKKYLTDWRKANP